LECEGGDFEFPGIGDDDGGVEEAVGAFFAEILDKKQIQRTHLKPVALFDSYIHW
jgi:hypothetical protein